MHYATIYLMVNKGFSVKDSVKNLDLEAISTNGYDFIWEVALNGYEWLDKNTLLFDKEFTKSRFFALHTPDVFMFPQKYHYNRNTILYYATLGRNTHSIQETHPESMDRDSPWLVAKGELELQKQQSGKTKAKDWKGIQIRQYSPLLVRTLHRQFASLNTESLETEVLKFANKYGLLGRTVYLCAKAGQGIVQGESIYRWQTEIERMGVLLAIWDLILWEDCDKLEQFFIWHHNPDHVGVRFKWQHKEGECEISRWDGSEKAAGFGHHHETVAIRSPIMLPDFFIEYKAGKTIGPARYWLSQKLNLHLYGIHPKLTGWQQPEVIHFPRTLLDALWLMFMLEVQGKTKVSRCKLCGTWFEWERSTKTYCTPSCRSLHFYHRRKLKEARNERKHKTKKQK